MQHVLKAFFITYMASYENIQPQSIQSSEKYFILMMLAVFEYTNLIAMIRCGYYQHKICVYIHKNVPEAMKLCMCMNAIK